MDHGNRLERLADALRGDLYMKGKGGMKFHRSDKDGIFHCPLGVACEVFLEENELSGSDWVFDDVTLQYEFASPGSMFLQRHYPPEEVLEYFSLNRMDAICIARINDNDNNRNFSEVIQFLEKRIKILYG